MRRKVAIVTLYGFSRLDCVETRHIGSLLLEGGAVSPLDVGMCDARDSQLRLEGGKLLPILSTLSLTLPRFRKKRDPMRLLEGERGKSYLQTLQRDLTTRLRDKWANETD